MLAVLEDKRPVIYGDGEQSRDFTFIDNVVDETLRAADTPGASGIVFNGGTGARITLNEVIRLLEKITGKKISPQYDPPRSGDIRDSQADVSRAEKILGYRPLVQFEEGLRRTWNWYSESWRPA
jgi:UDP-glucose 4-epimerase